MSSPLEKLEERIEKLEAASEEIRAATREAHEATKELRTVEKAVRDLLRTDARELVADSLREHVRKGLAEYDETVRHAMDQAVAKVGKEFEKLAAIYLDRELEPGETLHELAQRAGRARRDRPAGRTPTQ